MTYKIHAKRKQLTPVLLAAAFLLSACGIKGDLDTPPPIWGEKSGTAAPLDPADPVDPADTDG